MTAPASDPTDQLQWFVLRDLKRANSKSPAYKVLPQFGCEVFTPMRWVLRDNPQGGKTRLYLPYIPSLLFAKAARPILDEIVRKTDTLQYRYVKGAPQNTPMVVPTDEMTRFIKALSTQIDPQFYAPDEITPDMIGKEVIIKGGPLDGQTGRLLKLKGSRKKRIIIELKSIIIAAVEVQSEYLQLL